MEKNPKKRISAQEALQDIWIQKYSSQDLSTTIQLKSCLKNLKVFKHEGKLQRALFTFIVNQLVSNQQKEELLQTFKALDKNGDGVLSREELTEGFKLMYGEKKALQEVNALMRGNNKDYLRYSEWIMAAVNKKKILSEDNLIVVFKMIDKDGSGSIDLEEIKNIFKGAGQVSDQVWKDLIQEADKDGNGEIEYDEFKLLMEKMVLMEEENQFRSQNSLHSQKSVQQAYFHQLSLRSVQKQQQKPIEQNEEEEEEEDDDDEEKNQDKNKKKDNINESEDWKKLHFNWRTDKFEQTFY